MTKDIMHVAAFTAIAGSLLMAAGLFAPARTVAQGTQQGAEQSTGLLQGRAAFTDWSADRPGLPRYIRPPYLPAPALAPSFSNRARITRRSSTPHPAPP